MTPEAARREFRTERHTTSYLECGPPDGPLVMFLHGWPALAVMWRHQLEHFAGLGYRCVAPDMRGYGASSVPPNRDDYAIEEIVRDMVELLAGLGAERAIWVGHDWGSIIVWSIAGHHPELCRAVVSMCVPYFSEGFAPQTRIPLVDRTIYPEEKYPAGQWDYQLFYQDHFDAAAAAFEADVPATFKAFYRRGSAADVSRPSLTARISRDGGWFGGAGRAPDLPRDPAVLTEEDLAAYVAAFERTGFAGPDSWYANNERNARYAEQLGDARVLRMPVLFVHAAFDPIAETVNSRMAEPMRRDCADLTEHVLETGHWMPLERPAEVNAALAAWLSARVGDGSPGVR